MSVAEAASKVMGLEEAVDLKKLKKEVKEAGIIEEYRDRRYYIKKSQVKRVKKEDAERWQKKLDRDRRRYDNNTCWDFKKVR